MNFIFDLDDTLVRRDTVIPLQKRIETLELIANNKSMIYLATNMSCIGWRKYYEKLVSSDYKRYPSFDFSIIRLRYLSRLFDIDGCAAALIPGVEKVAQELRNWVLDPDEINSFNNEIHFSYRMDWRKPKGGMLEFLISKYHLKKSECLFVGDLPTDEQAAKNAGIAFQYAHEFFTIGE